MTEKLEDMVSIVFLPLVRNFILVISFILNVAVVLYVVWPEHQSRIARQWSESLGTCFAWSLTPDRYYMGLHSCHYRAFL